METKKLKKAVAMVGKFAHTRSARDEPRAIWVRDFGEGTAVSSTTPIGDIEVYINEPCGVDVCVQFSVLSNAVKSLREARTELESDESTLHLFTTKGQLSVPTRDTPHPTVHVCRDVGVCVESAELTKCSKRLRGLANTSEVRYSQSQRLYTQGDLLRIVCSNHQAWGCTWMQRDGGEMDALIPIASMLAAVECLPGEASDLSATDEGVSLVSGDVAMFLPYSSQGTTHRPYDNAEKVWHSSDVWRVHRKQVSQFLTQVKTIAPRGDVGVLLSPSESGLLCRYSGRGGFCECVIEGECSGDQMFVSGDLLRSAVECASDENFLMHATQHGLFVTSDGVAWGMGEIKPTGEDEE